MGEAQELQGFDQREQLVDDEMLLVGEVRQVGAAVIGRLGQRVDAGPESCCTEASGRR